MSEVGVLSDRYQRLSEWLIRFNEAVMFLKDVYLGKLQYESKAVEDWMNTVSLFLEYVLKNAASGNSSQSTIPESAIIAVQNLFERDPFLRASVANIHDTLTNRRFKKGLSSEDFETLDRIAALLSEDASRAFRRIWRHR